jgi:transmembrane sensor
MSDQTPWPLIAKYLAGECSEEEKLAMEWWLEEADNQILFEQVKTSWLEQSAYEISEDFNPEKGLNKLNALIEEAEGAGYQEDRQNYIKIRSWLAAASIIFLIGLGYFFIVKKTTKNPIQDVAWIEKVSGENQTMHFILPDGSKIWLNKNSKLVFPGQFAAEEREVFLEGEAFFDIIPNPKKPFVVKSNKLSTRVLGTSFNIKAYKGDEISYVSVATGKVEVSKEIKKGDPIRITQLTPQQELVIDTKKDETYIDIVSASGIGAWRKDQLVFHNHTYAEVISRLEANYEVKIDLKRKALARCRVMASFNEDASLEQVLKLLSISNHFSYTIEGKLVTIRGGICQ